MALKEGRFGGVERAGDERGALFLGCCLPLRPARVDVFGATIVGVEDAFGFNFDFEGDEEVDD